MTPFRPMLTTLARTRGVRAALLVEARDGVLVDAVTPVGLRSDAVAALAASVFGKAGRSVAAAGDGRVALLEIEATAGRVGVVGDDVLVLVAVADPRSSVALTRLALRQAWEALPR
jgi:predicted regulator of Ras-like GTPase activity (Roadblock/LC7/MglB family)